MHFDKNAHSRMNVSLATQVLSAFVADMIRQAIDDDDIELPLKKRECTIILLIFVIGGIL